MFDILFWIFFILFFFYPTIQKRYIEWKRYGKIKEIERKYNARVVTMIHRMETLSIFGIPVFKYITIEDAESILEAIRETPDDQTLMLIIHTPGGIALAAQQIALALKKRRGKTIVVIPHYAMSGGTLIALAADEIWMDENAVLGPVDPQLNIGTMVIPAASLVKAVEKKKEKVPTKYLILKDIAEKALQQIREFLYELLKDKYDKETVKKIVEELTSGKYTHDYPITAKKLKELGLNVKTEVPIEIYELLELYPQPELLASVEYIKRRRINKEKI